MPITSGVLVGNPRPASRTLSAALALRDAVHEVAEVTAGPVVDAAELAQEVFTPGSEKVRDALSELASVDVLVIASPTYKATYTGLLKAVLDQVAGGSWRGIIALPLQVAASDRHALAVDLHLRPLLVELGATVPGPGVFVNESKLGGGAGQHEALTSELSELLSSNGVADTVRALLAARVSPVTR